MSKRALVDDGDTILYFGPSQEERHEAMLQANALARELVARAIADDAAAVEPEEGETEDPPRRFRIVIGRDHEDMSERQRKFLHGVVLMQIADQVRPGGEAFPMPVWKEYYRKKFLGDRWVHYKLPGQKRATPHRERVSTEDLTVKQYSEYIEQVIADAVVEYGVEIECDPIEREGVRYVRKVRRQRARAEAQPA